MAMARPPLGVSPSRSPSPPRSSFHSQHPTLPMSPNSNTNSTPSNVAPLLDAALAKYTKRTGQNLRNHPLATAIERCTSPDSILAIFEEQSHAFDEFRNGDPKLIKWLRPVVIGLHAI